MAKSPPSVPAYHLAEQARALVARMDGSPDYSPDYDLAQDDPATAGVEPGELRAWLAECDRAIERRCYVARELADQLKRAKEEAAAWRARAARIEGEIERVKSPALALAQACRDLGEVDEAGEVHRRTPSGVSVWIASHDRIVGPEDGRAWPAVWQRVEVTPDRAGAKEVLQRYRDAAAEGVGVVTGELIELAQAGVSLERSESIGWRA